MDTAQEAPETVILAQDEASLYLQATLKVVWYPRGQTPCVKLDPSRHSIHFYGALNLLTGQETVMSSTLMNGEVTALYLNRLLQTYPEQPILLLWDRAPWHRGDPIRHLLAQNPRLQTFFFPPASPDLNPQEHVWKAARDAVSHNHRFTSFSDLTSAFSDYLTRTTFFSPLLDTYGYNHIRPMFI